MKQYLMSSMWVIGFLAAPVLTAETLDWPVGEFVPYELKSGELDNPGQERAPVYMETVHVAGAAWLRLYFREVELPPGSVLRMTSERDQEVQELDAAGIRMWNNTSAYFNGDTVHVELIAGPGTFGNSVVLDRVAMEMGNGGEDAGFCGICGNDDRVPSDEDFTGRIMPVGCTGSVWNENSCLVSAGHCVGSDDVIQFRVPDSDPDCDLNHPPVADQFPITGRRFRNAGIGADWSVMTTGTNNLGETAYERFGDLRRIATDVADVGDPIAVWGFAVDDQCTRNQTQQTDDGNITDVFDTFYEMNADVTFGNSGSGLIWNNQIIGIITHCPCPGKCTRVDNSDFVNARDELCPSGPPICIVHGDPDWNRNDPGTWTSFVDHAFSAYIDNKVESTDGNSRDLGLTRWDVVFNTEPFGDAAGGPITPANVSVSVTGVAAP
ncbi:MAG: hypothetical protein IID39_08790, partial [Planctomycetes bacterium]|nr:hypothetical protein [Planctomycetota bacterium]